MLSAVSAYRLQTTDNVNNISACSPAVQLTHTSIPPEWVCSIKNYPECRNTRKKKNQCKFSRIAPNLSEKFLFLLKKFIKFAMFTDPGNAYTHWNHYTCVMTPACGLCDSWLMHNQPLSRMLSAVDSEVWSGTLEKRTRLVMLETLIIRCASKLQREKLVTQRTSVNDVLWR